MVLTLTMGPETAQAQAAAEAARVRDVVERPAHYTQGKVECIDAIQSMLTPAEFRGFCKGSAMQYIWRERLKGGDETLAKAGWYLRRMVRK